MAEVVRGMLIPQGADALLLPSAVVEEVLGQRDAVSLPGAPPWLLGSIEWRHRRAPVVVLERALPTMAHSRISVRSRILLCRTLNQHNLPWIGFLSRSIPRLIRVTVENLRYRDPAAAYGALALMAVEVGGEAAVIPNLDEIERQILAVWGQA